MYQVLIYHLTTNELISSKIEYVLSSVIKMTNQRLVDLGQQARPYAEYLKLQNNVQVCLAPGIYVTRMEKEVSSLELPSVVNNEINIDAIDALKSIHYYLSVLEAYRGHIPMSIPKNEEAYNYTDKLSRFMTELHSVIRTSSWLSKELAL
jgi:hypothetical protein